MPKQKTRKTMIKRFKVTAGGKVLRARQNARHLRATKTKRQIRRYKEPKEVKGKLALHIRAFLP